MNRLYIEKVLLLVLLCNYEISLCMDVPQIIYREYKKIRKDKKIRDRLAESHNRIQSFEESRQLSSFIHTKDYNLTSYEDENDKGWDEKNDTRKYARNKKASVHSFSSPSKYVVL